MRAEGWPLSIPPRMRRALAPQAADLYAEDRALVSRILDGEEAAVESFGERYTPAVYRFAASRLGADRELVRDIVQTTLTKALGKLASYRGESSLLTWLCACCRNEILMHLRRRGSAPVTVELAAAERVPAGRTAEDAETGLLSRERAERVHLVLDSLPPRYADVLQWKYVEQLPVEAIGARLGLGLKAAESLLTRARQSFRGAFVDLERGGAEGGSGEGSEL